MRPAPLATLAVALVACRAAEPVDAPPDRPPVEPPVPEAPPPAALALPPAWDALGHFEFEEWVLAALPERSRTPLDDAAVAELAAALEASDETSVRAAVILARSADARAADVLIERLEARAVAPDRESDAGDVVAAGGLGRTAAGAPHAARLAALATGPRPHPDLEVRVECAASALAHGRPEVVPFLFRVLREATPAGLPDPADWERQDTMAWCKSRAAHALSVFCRAPVRFRPDASVADQMAAADRLEERVARRLLEGPP